MNKGATLLLGLAVGTAAAHQTPTASAHTLVAHASLNTNLTFQNNSTISGMILSPQRAPLRDIYVELLDDTYGSLGQTRTDSSGRFIFRGLPNGNYRLRVKPYGTDYMEQSKDVQLFALQRNTNAGVTGAVEEQVDFILRVRENANSGPLAAPGAIFVQEVPAEAKKLYETGIASLRDKKDKEGFESLKRSLEIFPNYYLALDRLGTEYVTRGHNEAAFVLLTKAVEVNPRGFSSMYGLGLAQYNLKLTDKAIESLQRATNLYNKSGGAFMWLGMALRRAGKYNEAEVALKRANELGEKKTAEVYWQMAALYNDMKRYNESADALELFLKNQPPSTDPEQVKKAEQLKQTIKQLRTKALTQTSGATPAKN
jgi:tetratricopeptide (TPR) repeat protein